MAFVQLPTIPPYGTVAVDADKVFAIVPDPPVDNVQNAVLLFDGNRTITVLKTPDEVANLLGPNFRKLQALSTDQSRIFMYINRSMVRLIRPHDTVPGAVHIFSVDRQLAAVGDVQTVTAMLS